MRQPMPPLLRLAFFGYWCRKLCYYQRRYAIVAGGSTPIGYSDGAGTPRDGGTK